ncbi:hypothetical protein [Methylobacterium sp. NEAU K]|uniref:hypothetical protein n=1 Tax=Methylobacterium sp. NEAU K TaxID=3064946 RepID=UPI0027370789|nr:hypothetical protein [Methylobacterium sp. NEAU K]MDP4004973.1 hypothetical protein [Methylobacterium sp. NEAU K]
MAGPTNEPGTVPRKPDDAVGTRGGPAAGGGRQTPEQAAITDIGDVELGRTEPKAGWSGSGEAGRSPPALGGSSGGHSDLKASRGPTAGEKVASGHARAERENQT